MSQVTDEMVEAFVIAGNIKAVELGLPKATMPDPVQRHVINAALEAILPLIVPAGGGEGKADTEAFAEYWHGEIEAIGAMLGIGAPDAGEVPRAVQALLSARPQPPQQPVAVDVVAALVKAARDMVPTEVSWKENPPHRDAYGVKILHQFGVISAMRKALADYDAALYAAPLAQPVAPIERPEGQTYYTEGKDAPWFEALSDTDFATRSIYAAQDIADGDFSAIENYIPVAAILSDAGERIRRLLAQPVATAGEEREMALEALARYLAIHDAHAGGDAAGVKKSIADATWRQFLPDASEYLEASGIFAALRPPVTQPNAEEAGK